MQFERLSAPVPDMDLWGSNDGQRSYVISFDRLHESLGYEASWQGDEATVYIGYFPSLAAAKKALRAVRDARAN